MQNVELTWPQQITRAVNADDTKRLQFVRNPYENIPFFPDYTPRDMEDTRTWLEFIKDGWNALLEFETVPRNILDTTLIVIVAISGAFLVLMLVFSVPPTWTAAQRDYWIEVMSQLLNAVFTLWAIINAFPRSIALSQYLKLRRAWKHAKFVEYDKRRREFQVGPPLWSMFIMSDPDGSRAASDSQYTDGVASDAQHTDGVASDAQYMERPETVKSDEPLIKDNKQFPTPVPNDWVGWMLVLLLLNCIMQIPLSLAMWIYAGRHQERPQWIIALFLPFAFLSVVVAYAWLYVYAHLWNKRRRLYHQEHAV